MKCYAIVIKGNRISEAGYRNLNASNKNDFDIEIFDAITPETIPDTGLEYTYPTEGSRHDSKSDLYLSAYETGTLEKRIACFYSHYLLWQKCHEENESLLIFEHDAEVVKKIPVDSLEKSRYGIIGLNNPIGATRKSRTFHDHIVGGQAGIVPAPYIDHLYIPQGLAGNSAYYIKPRAAYKLLELVKEHGIWPNDALMCKQLLPKELAVTNPFFTKIQGLPSTTTL